MLKTTSPHVSVIIPCYNGALFLKATLDSVFAQNYADFEVIVIDDGSTDGTRHILKEFGDRLRVVSTENRGVSAARNLGTKMALGALIQYLDADDLLRPNALASRVQALKGIVYGVALSEWQEMRETAPGQYHFSAHGRPNFDALADPEESIFAGFWAPPAAVMYTREIVARIGGWNEKLPVIQDARFLLDAAFCGAQFIVIPEISADYRIALQASLSRQSRAKFIADQETNLADVERHWYANGEPSAERIKLLRAAHGAVVRAWYPLDRTRFQSALLNASKRYPGFIPDGSNAYKWLCAFFGIPIAERIALAVRTFKHRVLGQLPH